MVVVTHETGRWRLFDDTSRDVDRFGLLLFIGGLAVVTLSLVDLKGVSRDWQAEIGTILVSLFVGATLLLSLRASGVTRRFRVIAATVVGVGVFATIAAVLLERSSTGSQDLADLAASSVAWVVLSVGAPVVVVRRLIHHQRATRTTLLGAVSAYLLIAMAFNFVFLTLNAYGSSPFFGAEEPTTSFMYYSLVTITTLGFGDLAAAEPLGRMLSTFEAVIGQVYLVTFVAMIVGLMVGQRQVTGRTE
jgi:hypothetical protein